MLIQQRIRWQGKKLGRYQLSRLLGQGGMGEVWEAEDTQLHRPVAVKVLLPVMMSDEDYLKAFLNEARMAATLEHPHILQVHDFGEITLEDQVITYLILPFITGGSLRERIESTPQGLPIATSLTYLRQAAQAVDYAHNQQMLHRDIKPANMLLQDDWLFLSDFGLAKLLTTNSYRSNTQIGIGTPEYMAPEQIKGQAQPESDLYSLAIVAYQLLTGRVPFQGGMFDIFLKHIHEEPPAPRQLNKALTEAMEQTLFKGLAKQPSDRHQSCTAFVDELEEGWKRRLDASNHDPDATAIAPWNVRAHSEKAADTYIDEYATIENPDTIATDDQTNSLVTAETAPSPVADSARTIKRRNVIIGAASALVFLAGGGYALTTTLMRTGAHIGPRQLIAGVPLLKLTAHILPVWNARWNPEGRYLATGGNDSRALLWDIDALVSSQVDHVRTVATPSLNWQISSQSSSSLNLGYLDWSADGQKLAVLATSSTSLADSASDTMNNPVIIEPFTPNFSPNFKNGGVNNNALNSWLACSPVDEKIATIYNTIPTYIGLWIPSGNEELLKIQLASPQIQDNSNINILAMAWSKDGRYIIGLNLDNQLLISAVIWDVIAGAKATPLSITLPKRMPPQASSTTKNIYTPCVRSSPGDATQFAMNNMDCIIIGNAPKKKVLRILTSDDPAARKTLPFLPDGGFNSPLYPQVGPLAWSPDGRYIAGCYISSNQIYIWDLQDPHPHTTKEGFQLPILAFGKTGGHSGPIYDLSWSPDGRYLASASQDTTVIVWKVDGA